MRGTLLGDSITFRDQGNSRNRALSASMDGKLATIDLSAASDRLSCRLVEYVFQGSEILDGLHASRTRWLSQNLSDHLPSKLVLRKFATMGSAVIFPIQSIVYCILTVWALRLHDGLHKTFDGIEESFREVTVFGDDIIAPTRALETIKLVLHECGLKVNASKTFGGSNFRESCGMDAFRGHEVTPAYILQPYDASPSAMAATVEASNNMFYHGYWYAARTIAHQLPEKELKLLRVVKAPIDKLIPRRDQPNYEVPGATDGSFGLRSYCGSSDLHLKKVWNQALQRTENIGLAVSCKTDRARGRGSSDLTQYFFEDPDPDFQWSAGKVAAVRLRKRLTRVPS